MKLRDLISEYGMQPGAPTPSSQQRTGNITQKSEPSPNQQQSDSPSTDPDAQQAQPDQQDTTQQPDIRELEQGASISSEDGRELEITSAYGNNSGIQGDSTNVVVATDKQTGEQFIMDPEQMQESPQTLKFITPHEKQLRETRQRYKATKRKLRKMRDKHQANSEPLLEVDFNNKQLIQSALNAEISCGFEAESIWEEIADDEASVDLDWEEINDQISSRDQERVIDAYRDWISDHDRTYELQQEAEREWAEGYESDVGFIADFVRENSMEDEVESYKEMLLDDDPETYDEFTDADWQKEFVHVEKIDEFTEWLLEQAQDQGIGWDEAFEKMESEYSVDDWIDEVYSGNYFEFMMDFDIYLDSGQGGLEEVGAQLENWVDSFSDFVDVNVGEYHDGVSTTQDYWRVEPDPSIEGAAGQAAEIISPVYQTPAAMLREMSDLFGFFQANDVITNESTGLHVTMSMSQDQTRSEPNYLKMALLLGDRYILKQFDRLDNMYTPSQLNRLEAKVKQVANSDEYNIQDLAQIEQILQRAVNMDKYSSINFKQIKNNAGNQLIEFRIAGGDAFHTDMDKVTQAVSRYAIIMQAGYDDSAHRKDYVKAIARLINNVTGSGKTDKHFAGLPDSPLVHAVKQLLPQLNATDTILDQLRLVYGITESSGEVQNKPEFFKFIGLLISAIMRKPDIKITTQTILGMRKAFQEVGATLDDYLKFFMSKARELDLPEENINSKLEILGRLMGKKGLQVSADHEPPRVEMDYSKFVYLASREWASQLGSVPAENIKLEGNLIPVGRNEYRQALLALQGLEQPGLEPEKAEAFQEVVDLFNNKYEVNLVQPGVIANSLPAHQVHISVSAERLRQAGFQVKVITGSTQFESMSLEEQLNIVRKLDETKLAKRHAKAWQKLQEYTLQESVPEVSSNTELKRILSKPLLAGDLRAQMKAYIALPVPAMLKTFRQERADQGDNHDLRDVVKQYVRAYKPDTRKLQEGVSKDDIIQAIQDMDPKNDAHLDLLNRIYKIVHSGVIGQNIDRAFATTLDDENLSSGELEQVKRDITKIIGQMDIDFGALEKFVERMEKDGGVVNIQELAKPLTTLDAILGDEAALTAFYSLAGYGMGRKQKGPGEYALACLSNKIKLAEHEGDLEVDGIGKVELKAALSKGGGRIGYGGDTQDIRRGVIDKYAENIPTVIAQIGTGGGSLGLGKFIAGLNQDLPVNKPENQRLRKQIVLDLLKRDMGQFANEVANKIATSEDFTDIENTYLIQNFLWYRDRDNFDALLLMHLPNRKSAMIRNENELTAFRRSGHANAIRVSIIPTQAGAGREQWAQLTLNKQGL